MPTVRALEAASSALTGCRLSGRDRVLGPRGFLVDPGRQLIVRGRVHRGERAADRSSTGENVSGLEVMSSSTSSPSTVPVKWNVYLPGCEGTKSRSVVAGLTEHQLAVLEEERRLQVHRLGGLVAEGDLDGHVAGLQVGDGFAVVHER